jgi:hypothetical protein
VFASRVFSAPLPALESAKALFFLAALGLIVTTLGFDVTSMPDPFLKNSALLCAAVWVFNEALFAGADTPFRILRPGTGSDARNRSPIHVRVGCA